MACSTADELGINQLIEMNDSNIKDVESTQNTSVSIEPNYSTLVSMFPNVDTKYIRQICIKPPYDKIEDDLLVMLINHLLSYEDKIDDISNILDNKNEIGVNNTFNDELLSKFIFQDEQEVTQTIMNDRILSEMLETQDIEAMEQQKQQKKMLHEQLLSEFLEKDQEVIDEKMEMLVNILPDVNPAELRKYVQENHENGESLEQFVELKLLDKNYEKRDQYYHRMKTKEKIALYTTHFNIEKFIMQFPDPFQHFENPDRECTFQEQALNFLKERYAEIAQSEYVANMYNTSKYNLSITDKHLQSMYTNNQKEQLDIEIDNVPLLQEIAFIQNKTNIQEYLEVIKQKEEKEMRFLRANKLLVECQCCYDEVNPAKCVECDNEHIFCRKCVIKGTDVAITNGETSIRCFMGCNNEIPLNILRKVLPLNIFDTFLKKRQEIEVKAAKLDDLVTCPFCPYSMELAPQIQIFTCKNPECMKISCRLCRKMNHLPIKCEDVLDEHKGRLYIEEEMSKALIRNCYRCNRPFVKDYGCNKMTCYCGAMMCYICRQPITDYSHFDRNNCKTNQNSDRFDEEQIQLRKTQARTKINTDFPDLQIPDV